MLAGSITWHDYRHNDSTNVVNIRHRKTGVIFPLPLEDESGAPFYPELDAYLADLPRLGLPIVLTSGERGKAHPYSMVFAQRRVREAREHASLGKHVTLDACRHGGLTEAADAGATDQGLRALSGHKTTAALRVYLKQTAVQRMVASCQRRDHVEKNRSGAKVRIGRQISSQNGGVQNC